MPWQSIKIPKLPFAFPGCSQWLIREDGNIYIPLSYEPHSDSFFATTVAHCHFDGEHLFYVDHGTVLQIDIRRGLYEPSLTEFKGRYYLTMRGEHDGYVSAGDDPMELPSPVPWSFDDDTPLESISTQQHWITHSDQLYLVYTRKTDLNRHIPRFRAPLFICEVDTARLCLVKKTEKVLLPEDGVALGNFGVANITTNETWVTVGENMATKSPESQGAACGRILLARITWNSPNKLRR